MYSGNYKNDISLKIPKKDKFKLRVIETISKKSNFRLSDFDMNNYEIFRIKINNRENRGIRLKNFNDSRQSLDLIQFGEDQFVLVFIRENLRNVIDKARIIGSYSVKREQKKRFYNYKEVKNPEFVNKIYIKGKALPGRKLSIK